MRLYLSSFGLGNQPEQLLGLLGSGRRVGLILNAVDLKTPEKREISKNEQLSDLKSLGLEPTEIDLRLHFGQSPEVMKAMLGSFDLLWLRGGNTFVLRRALRQSGADEAIRSLLVEDRLVYGGFSAAAAVLASSLRGVDIVDGPNDVPDGYAKETIWEGLGILPYAIAPHYHSDHPESDGVGRMVAYYIKNHVPFIALRDGEALVCSGTSERVVV